MMRDSIDGLIDEAESDDFYRAATDVKNDFRAMGPGTRRDIVMLRNYIPASTTNTLAISHALYGNVTREHDIEEINAIPDPCFVRGGIVLRVPHV
jgi:hypothetical protein